MISFPEEGLSFFTYERHGADDVVRRITLSRDMQDRLTQHFSSCADRFVTNDHEPVAFDGRYKPDEQEILYVDDFGLPQGIIDALSNPVTTDVVSLHKGEVPPIKAIFTGWEDEEGIKVLFQLFKKNQFLTRQGLSLVLSNDTFRELSTPGLVVTDDLVAIYKNGRVLFRSYSQAKQVLNLNDFYREATNPDIENFLNNENIYAEDWQAFFDNSDQWVRRKLALVMDRGLFEHHDADDISRCAEGYGLEVTFSEVDGRQALVIPEEKKELKNLLRFLDEDFYEGPLSAAQYLSNSKRPVND